MSRRPTYNGGPVFQLPGSPVELDAMSPRVQDLILEDRIEAPGADTHLDGHDLERVQAAYESLPAIEQDLVTLRYGGGRRTEDALGRLLGGMSQQRTSYALRKTLRRLAGHLLLPQLTVKDLTRIVAAVTPQASREGHREVAKWLLNQGPRPTRPAAAVLYAIREPRRFEHVIVYAMVLFLRSARFRTRPYRK